MEHLAKRYPSQLSGGQQQRIALARALVFEPKLVLMDEPLGALDKQLREQMQHELKSLHSKLGVTFIYVTHDQNEALAMSDRVAVFDKGNVQQIDSVERLYETPRNPLVASFVGDSNRFYGTVIEVDGRFCGLRLKDGTNVRGVKIGDIQMGEAVTAIIRPERMRLVDDHHKNEHNTISGKIKRSVYFGDHIRLHFSHSGLDDLFLKIPLNAHIHNELIPGKIIHVAFDCRHFRIFS
ncbi:Spermidine/putrescine import ATP-binding protein PotA [Burkholderia oklahomensis]|nr:ABC transporter family protein [Burkholderia oklahomensis C6786]SUW56423.1 Spermidine/putrescine import ATP-binding protein PotA [Burkholderia oklahomensis]